MVLPSNSDIWVRLNSTVENKIASFVDHNIFQFFGKERGHVSVQTIINNDCEVTPNTAMLIESLNTILSTVIQGNIINLYMLEICLIVNVCVIIGNNGFFIFEPFDYRPGIANNTTSQLYRLANLDPSIARSINHIRSQREMDKTLPPGR